MRRKNRFHCMRRGIGLAGLCLGLAFGPACQPTPKTEIISQKENIEDVVSDYEKGAKASGSLREQTGAPDQVSFTITLSEDGTTLVAEDVPVEMPDTDKAGVVSAVRADLTQGQIQGLVEQFFDGKTAYVILPMTKEDYMNGIKSYEEELARLTKENGDESYIESLKGQISYYQDQIKAAPSADSLKTEPVEFVWKPGEIHSIGEEMSGENNEGDVTYRFLAAKHEAFMSLTLFQAPKAGTRPNYIAGEKDTPVSCQYSPEEAGQMALDFLAEAGIPMGGLMVIGAEPVMCVERQDEGIIGYRVRLGHGAGQVAPVYAVNRIAYTGQESQNEGILPYDYERIEAIVTDQGVTELEWENPMAEGEALADHVALMSFDQIQQIIQEQAGYAWEKYMSADGMESETPTICLGKIVFGMMRVQNPDKEGEYTLIPVWDVFPINSVTEAISDGSMLTINAMDGSIIDRSSGH